MEIGATTSAAYLPPQFAPMAEFRGRGSVAREIPSSQAATAALSSANKDFGRQNPVLPNGAEAQNATQNSNAPQVNESGNPQKREVSPVATGSIKLDIQDGHHVLKVYDSKDVLIYQLPPKGELTLIKEQERAQQSQVKTSA
jgi:hypothetical protein